MPNFKATGRPASPEPKNNNINIRVTDQERGDIERLASIMETSKTRAIVTAVRDKLDQLEPNPESK